MRRMRAVTVAAAGAAAALLALSGCDTAPPPPVDPPPADLPEPLPDPEPEPDLPARSEQSLALGLYYQRLQADLLAQGLLRGDGGGADAPFTDTMLARNFIRIALYDEYVDDGSTLRPEATISRLRRWDGPVRVSVDFGATVDPDQAARDRAAVGAYVARLARLTGLSMTLGAPSPNYHVLFLNEDDRLAAADRLRELVPGIAESSVRTIVNLPRSTLCVVVAFSEPGSQVYSRAIAIIRAEHPEVMRLACIHEEIAQGLGLANDHPAVRPSIFNDDEEFGLLTGHDELLLRMLYDPRLSPGMTAAEAAPIARQIASELLAPS